MQAFTRARRSGWLVPAALILLSLVPAAAGTGRLAGLATGAAVTPANERFFAMPLPIVLHLLAAIPYSLVGALQFSTVLRRRHPRWHRGAGRVLVVLGMLVALSGLWMTIAYPWANHDGVAVYGMRLLVGSAMATSIGLGVAAIRRRDFTAHGAWMIRAYAIALGAGTQVLTHLPWFVLVGEPGETSRAIMMGAAWTINVAVAEWIIRKDRREPSRARVASVGNEPRAVLRETHHAY